MDRHSNRRRQASESRRRLSMAGGRRSPPGKQAANENAKVIESRDKQKEAPVGVEPTNGGFAIRCLSHLATAPRIDVP